MLSAYRADSNTWILQGLDNDEIIMFLRNRAILGNMHWRSFDKSLGNVSFMYHDVVDGYAWGPG